MQAELPMGFLRGLFVKAVSPTAVEVLPGDCRDSANKIDLRLDAPFTKRINDIFTEGNGKGGLPYSVVLEPLTFIHVFILGSLSGDVDIGFDKCLNASNLLECTVKYTMYRRLGHRLILDDLTIRQTQPPITDITFYN